MLKIFLKNLILSGAKGFCLILFASTLFQGCSMFKLTVSENRIHQPEAIIIGENIEIASCGILNVNKVDFLPAAFKLKDNGIVLYIDPVALSDSPKADYILITHAHFDHFSKADIQKIMKPETMIICPKTVAKKLSGYKNIKTVIPGDIIEFGNMKIEAVAAYNTKGVLWWINAHPKKIENVGYIVSFSNGKRLYHCGDTHVIPEMNDIKNIAIALISISGKNLTMDAIGGARAINTINPEIAVPMHYEMGKKDALDQFKKLIERSIQVKILE